MKTRRDEIVSQLHQLQSEVNVVMNFLGDDKVMKTMETMRDPKTLSSYLTKDFGVSKYSFHFSFFIDVNASTIFRYIYLNFNILRNIQILM